MAEKTQEKGTTSIQSQRRKARIRQQRMQKLFIAAVILIILIAVNEGGFVCFLWFFLL